MESQVGAVTFLFIFLMVPAQLEIIKSKTALPLTQRILPPLTLPHVQYVCNHTKSNPFLALNCIFPDYFCHLCNVNKHNARSIALGTVCTFAVQALFFCVFLDY